MLRKKNDPNLWRAVEMSSGVLAGLAARPALRNGWQWLTNSKPPKPASLRTPFSKAIFWSAGMGLSIGVFRMLVKRSAAKGWKKTTGRKAPT